MAGNLKESLYGIGIGLVGGLVIGISDNDWLRVTITLAFLAYAVKSLQQISEIQAGNSYRIGFTGIASFLAVLIGLYFNGQQPFSQTHKDAISDLVTAGYSHAQSREIYSMHYVSGNQKNDSVELKFQTLIQSLSVPAGSDSLVLEKDSI